MPALFDPPDPDFARRVRDDFARQAVMKTFGATLSVVEPGEVELRMPFSAALAQQHGYLHAGVVTTLSDSACGYAALSLMPQGSGVLAVEFKVNLLRPAVGDEFVARGRVLKAGRTLTVAVGEVHALQQGEQRQVLHMQATMMRIEERA